MSVLSRELDSYQRAVDAYQRRLNSYNRSVDAYRDTLVRDANGNLLVVNSSGQVFSADDTGRLTAGRLPSGTIKDYGATTLPGDKRFRVLRQNPIDTQRETKTGVKKYRDSESNEEFYYTERREESGDGENIVWDRLSPEWKLEKEIPGRWIDGGDSSYQEQPTYEFSRDASVYFEQPEEWTKTFNRQAPDPTGAQTRRAGRPTLAQIEGGLIGEVMKGSGVRYGVPVYRPKNL